MIRYLSLSQVLLIAEEVTKVPAETLMRVVRLELLQSAIAAPETNFIGLNPYPEIIDKAAVLALHIARNHALPDGNKRLAFLAALEFLWINGFDLEYELDEAESIFFGLAAGKIDINQLRDWFSENMVERSGY